MYIYIYIYTYIYMYIYIYIYIYIYEKTKYSDVFFIYDNVPVFQILLNHLQSN